MIVTLPKVVSIPIPGCNDLIIVRDDITSKKAWWKLTKKRDQYLDQSDFVEYDMYLRYFLVSLGLLEFPMVLIAGTEGGGKSLFLAWMAYQITRLFNKRCTLDWTPPEPKMFGNYFSFYDEDFTEKIQEGLNKLYHLTREEEREPTQEELEKLVIYNTNFMLDEGDSYGDKSSRTNLTKLIGRIIRRRRHYHTGIFMAFVDANDADMRMIFDRRTHEVSCAKDWLRRDWCSYLITNKRNGVKKFLSLNPEDWSRVKLWNSHNTVELSHDIEVHLGGKHKKKTTKDIETDKW
jgi:hypothetical protein